MQVPLIDEHDDVARLQPEVVAATTRMLRAEVEQAMRTIINVVHASTTSFMGTLAVEVGTSIEKVERVVEHLVKLGVVSIMDTEELSRAGLNKYHTIVKFQRLI